MIPDGKLLILNNYLSVILNYKLTLSKYDRILLILDLYILMPYICYINYSF